MNIGDVELRIAEIERNKDDAEVAHSMADDLYRDVLRAIAFGEAEHVKQLAYVALRVEGVEFSRHTA